MMAGNNQGLNVFEAAQQWQSSFPMLLDRVEGTWVVTGWATDDDDEDVTLRLRVSFSPDEDAVLFQFDAAAAGGHDFVQLGEGRASCLCAHGLAEDCVPELWREEFLEMVRRWATMTLILEPTDHYVPALAASRFPEVAAVASKTDSSEEGGR